MLEPVILIRASVEYSKLLLLKFTIAIYQK